ncbi:hypothetical protein PILCRDRAFT_76824 [Piloderma croceum F 1598]|uniref:Protein kinase domain-containing protein n=1 Tax=Piloderma croceum (strain F 1598) TaxID=765440 RepID=A0A0C3FCC6_PILCF|nr:hypothetical protein PILCRDRAFT_76824 [Piloderma croceum F 1598]
MHPDAFDVIPYEDIKGNWKKLGSGSFGNVYKGAYLGIDVAIKEVLPSGEYDVAKYFEREWRLMKEARHPNVVLYLGLSRSPEPDGRIFIISEYIENGNLRMYIHDKHKPFPWRLRLSFAIDIARALAYLHARKCIHRDLKGENLLVTSNGRLKITDFGFARIAARNEDESKRLTFCGTDSYMSPEILLGNEFDLPTDIFSLGIILCEIAARKLADDYHFKRAAPTFGIDIEEVKRRASPGCPGAFIKLCLDCLALEPAARPTTRVILDQLREIEAEVLLRPSETDDMHVGSVKFMMSGKVGHTLRIPSFNMGRGKNKGIEDKAKASDEENTSSEDELAEAIMGLNVVHSTTLDHSATSSSISTQPLLQDPTTRSEYSTTVIRSHSSQATNTVPPSLSSILTIRPDPSSNSDCTVRPDPDTGPAAPPAPQPISSEIYNTDSLLSIETYHTTHSSVISTAAATEGGSTIRSIPMVHRFTLIKPGAKRPTTPSTANGHEVGRGSRSASPMRTVEAGWNPLDLFFSSGLLMAKCDICLKRIGWKPVLECDDCGLRTHIKCGEVAPMDCGIQPIRPNTVHTGSPLLRLKQNIKSASSSPGK